MNIWAMWLLFSLMTSVGLTAFYEGYLKLVQERWLAAVSWLAASAGISICAGYFLTHAGAF